jgi:hypothetical protein
MVYFQTKNPNLGKIWESLAKKDVGKLYGHLVYSIYILYILLPFGIFCGHCDTFSPFWYIVARKNLATLAKKNREEGDNTLQ